MLPVLQKLSCESAMVLIVDVQEKLLPAVVQAEACVAAVERLLRAAAVLGVPMLATEQYPAGLGPTRPSVRQLLGEAPVLEKLTFSACTEELIERLQAMNRRQIIVAGIEAHVCMQQSVLDLLRLGYVPFVCADATTSRRELDCRVGLERMRQAGAIVTTTESVILELLGAAGTPAFKQILSIVK